MEIPNSGLFLSKTAKKQEKKKSSRGPIKYIESKPDYANTIKEIQKKFSSFKVGKDYFIDHISNKVYLEINFGNISSAKAVSSKLPVAYKDFNDLKCVSQSRIDLQYCGREGLTLTMGEKMGKYYKVMRENDSSPNVVSLRNLIIIIVRNPLKGR